MENKSFKLTYSAKQQEEIKKIRDKYIPAPPDKLEQLRRLDESVTRKATVVSLVIGIIGSLVLGVGMCCCMVWEGLFALGIFVGIIGIAAVAAAYPMYTHIMKKEREKIAPEILKLTDELMK